LVAREMEAPRELVMETVKKCGICQCGKSKNRPFCDGNHIEIFK